MRPLSRFFIRVPCPGAPTLLLGLFLFACGPPRLERYREPVSGIEFIRVPAGEFQMGSPADEPGREEQERQHRVILTKPFYLGATEVTQQQWEKVLAENPSQFQDCGSDCPVERVNFHDVQRFIGRLEQLTGRRFRLPTEAEWEYACRAGTTTPFNTGSTLTADQANFDGRYPYPGTAPGEYRAQPTPARSFPPNRWGFHDMHGNVWEWIEDWHCPYSETTVSDPLGSCPSPHHVIRGGSWYFDANSARCALRYTHEPQDLGFSLGFRLAMDAPPDPDSSTRP